MNRDSGSGFFAGLIVGALIGAAIALLYAPQPGADTRRVVKEKVGVARDAVVKAAGRTKDTVFNRASSQNETE